MNRRRSTTKRKTRRTYPFLIADPVRLSRHRSALEQIEESHWYTNFGPETARFESAFLDTLFGGEGACTTIANATLGLLLSVRASMLTAFSAAERRKRTIGIVPSFTFPATAQALVWNGLEIAFCDIDPKTWLPSAASIQRLIDRFGSKIGAIVPYATFGNNLDLAWYEALRDRHGIPIVVDAAASVGSRLESGRHFGAGTALPIVFSMHATKVLATSEGGVVYSNDAKHIADVRSMSNFGFNADRVVMLPGLNAKLAELGALQARLKLRNVAKIVRLRERLVRRYRKRLPDFTFQEAAGNPAHPFLAVRIEGAAPDRDRAIARAAANGVELRKYYNPPLHRQAVFSAIAAECPVTDDLANRTITLPLYDSLTLADVDRIAEVVRDATR